MAVGIVLVAVFLCISDASLVNVLVPALRADIGAAMPQVQLAIAAYHVGYAALLITGGRLGDHLGHRRIFVAGLAGFVASSLLCGFAWTPSTLTAGRAAQGVAAGIMFPQALALIRKIVPQDERPRALALFGMIGALGAISGPLVAGLLVQADVLGSSWRGAFLINLPVGIATIALALRHLPSGRTTHAPGFDFAGGAFVAIAVGSLVVALVEGNYLGWPVWTISALAVAPAVLGAFAWRCHRLATQGKSPLVPPLLWSQRSFGLGLGAYILTYACVPSFFLSMSITLQEGFDYTPLRTALTGCFFALGAILGYRLSALATQRFGAWRVSLTGSASWTATTAALAIASKGSAPALADDLLIPLLAVSGCAIGLLTAPLLGLIIDDVPAAVSGAASGVLSTGQQIGSAVGIAATGTFYSAALGGHDVARGAYASAFADALVLISALLAATFVLVLLLQPRKVRPQ